MSMLGNSVWCVVTFNDRRWVPSQLFTFIPSRCPIAYYTSWAYTVSPISYCTSWVYIAKSYPILNIVKSWASGRTFWKKSPAILPLFAGHFLKWQDICSNLDFIAIYRSTHIHLNVPLNRFVLDAFLLSSIFLFFLGFRCSEYLKNLNTAGESDLLMPIK